MTDPNPEAVVVPDRDAVAEAINQGEHKAGESSVPHSMTASIFISYASKDRAAAHTICDALEHRGFDCWIADRDIGPGENFQVSIVHAIRSAKVMILVFSANAANSEEIKKEVVLAGQSRLVVIPVRVEDVTPDEAFAYEMATRQWIDLFGDWEQSVQRLVRQLETVIHVKPDLKVAADTPVVEHGSRSHKEPSSPCFPEPAASRAGPRKSSMTAMPVGVGLLTLLVIAGVGVVTQHAFTGQEPVTKQSASMLGRSIDDNIPFRCGLSPGPCYYAIYNNHGSAVRYFSISGSATNLIKGVSRNDVYCVSNVKPPSDQKDCTDSDNPWRWHPRLVGNGDGFNPPDQRIVLQP
jgi:hypothetical protein